MISFEEAYSTVIDAAKIVGLEKVTHEKSLNRILAEDVISDVDMPPFNKTAVDGFACRKEDLANELEIIELIPAGQLPIKKVEANQCAKIMTGAMVPEGADTVIMVEHTKSPGENKIKFVKEKTSTNICYLAEDVKRGETVLKKGVRIKPQDIAVMASVGCVNPLVYRKISVGVISTGNELVEPDKLPALSQIRNSNASQLVAQVNRLGLEAHYTGIALDTRESTRMMITLALAESDVILLSGGVSMGDYDYVPEIFEELGINILFKSIAVQPGRPTLFCEKDGKYLFGLPGNPVSSFVLFEILVKPFLYKLMGHNYHAFTVRAPMGIDYFRKKSTRKSLLPVLLREDGK
ncbi:MAG: molybdopterin molybdotransferase MoeA, partial [Bacteroidales bacterium]|nr:molybdopterin molybdotransferase MoeA [Bacteroidales bacterium]